MQLNLRLDIHQAFVPLKEKTSTNSLYLLAIYILA